MITTTKHAILLLVSSEFLNHHCFPTACSAVTNGGCESATAMSTVGVGTTLDACITACGTSGIAAVHLVDSASCLCYTTCTTVITQRVDLTTACTPPGCTVAADTTCNGAADVTDTNAVTSADDCVTYCNAQATANSVTYQSAVLVGTSCGCYVTCTAVTLSFCAY